MHIYQNTTVKPVETFVSDLDRAARRRGFVIHNEETMQMAQTFGRHGADVAKNFDLHMIQICKPAKASRSLEKNPERAILMPKFIMAFTADSVTQVRFLHFHPDVVRSLVDDDEFPETLAASFAEIIDIIEEVS